MRAPSSDASLADTVAAGDARASRTVTIDLKGLAFSDQTIEIRLGDTVVWTNFDSQFHVIEEGNFRRPPLDPLFKSTPILTGQKFSFTPARSGDIEYYCSNHKNVMNRAHIIVTE